MTQEPAAASSAAGGQHSETFFLLAGASLQLEVVLFWFASCGWLGGRDGGLTLSGQELLILALESRGSATVAGPGPAPGRRYGHGDSDASES